MKTTTTQVKATEVSENAYNLMLQINEMVSDEIGRYAKKEVANKVINNARSIARKLEIVLSVGEIESDGGAIYHARKAAQAAAIVSGLAIASQDYDARPRIKVELEKIIARMLFIATYCKL